MPQNPEIKWDGNTWFVSLPVEEQGARCKIRA